MTGPTRLKPGKPLRRRTPLVSVTSLQRRTGLQPGRLPDRTELADVIPLQRRKPLARVVELRPRSAKTARVYEVRRPLVAEILETRPWCEIRWDAKCQGRSVDVHEPKMRSRGADICDPAECVAACRYCHDAVHTHPAEATRRGWLIPSGNPTAPEGGDAA